MVRNNLYSLICIHLFLISQSLGESKHDEHLRKAERGDINSIRYMSFSNTLENKPEEALRWLKKAANLGDARSQYGVGLCYENGDGTEANNSEAFSWYKKSADQNFPAALSALADCYRAGRGVQEDFETAKNLYQKAILLGDVDAKSGFGGILMIEEAEKKEKGEPHNFSAALKLIREASSSGAERGHRYLGHAFQYGYGVPQDYSEAIKFYKKASEGGDNKCFMELSACFENLRDLTSAYMWANVADACGEAKAPAAKSRLKIMLLGTSLAKAQADSRAWLLNFRQVE